MTSIEQFNRTIDRAAKLLNLSESPEVKVQGAVVTSDLLRASLVIAVAAMDAYFTSRFTEHLVPYLKSASNSKNSQVPNNLVDLLSLGGLNARSALEMLTMDRPYRRIRTIVDAYLSTYTTQQHHVIDSLFLCYGVKDLSVNAQAITKRKKLLDSVAKAVKRRHQIAHDGDVNQHYKTRPIAVKQVSNWITDITLYVSSCEELIGRVITNNMKKHIRTRKGTSRR